MLLHYSEMQLGRNPHNPAQLAAMPMLQSHLIGSRKPKQKIIRTMQPNIRLDNNDTLRNCTAVGYANYARSVAAINGFQLDIPTDKVVKLYCNTTGYVIGQDNTDLGGNMANVLTWIRKNGFDTGGQVPLATNFGLIEPDNRNLMANVIDEFGCVACGAALAESDQVGDTTDIWDIDRPPSWGNPANYSWGDHDLNLWAYTGLTDTDLVDVETWGFVKKATWRWVQKRCEEAYGQLFRQLMSPTKTISIDYDRLDADLETFSLKKFV